MELLQRKHNSKANFFTNKCKAIRDSSGFQKANFFTNKCI